MRATQQASTETVPDSAPYEHYSSRTRHALWIAALLKISGLTWSLTHTGPIFSAELGLALFLHILLFLSLIHTLVALDLTHDRTVHTLPPASGVLWCLLTVCTLVMLVTLTVLICLDSWNFTSDVAWCASWALLWAWASVFLDLIALLFFRLLAAVRHELPHPPLSATNALPQGLGGARAALQRSSDSIEEEHAPLFNDDVEAHPASQPEASGSAIPPSYEASTSTPVDTQAKR